jgi:hypothetical protein
MALELSELARLEGDDVAELEWYDLALEIEREAKEFTKGLIDT